MPGHPHAPHPFDSIRQFAWFVQGGDCPQLRLADNGTSISEPIFRIYPNPINEKSVLEIQISQAETVAVSMFDITDRKVRQLQAPRPMKPGTHSIPLPQHLNQGRYFLRIQVGEQSIVKAMQVVR